MTHIRCFRFSVRFSRLSCCLLSFQRLWFNKRFELCHAFATKFNPYRALAAPMHNQCVGCGGTVALLRHPAHTHRLCIYSIWAESNVLRLCFSNAFRLLFLFLSLSLPVPFILASHKINTQYLLVICFKRINRWQMEQVLPHRLSIYMECIRIDAQHCRLLFVCARSKLKIPWKIYFVERKNRKWIGLCRDKYLITSLAVWSIYALWWLAFHLT